MFPLIPEAMAQSVAGSLTESPLFGMIPFVLIFVVFYLLLIRPQQKKQKALQQMIQNLQKGDKVITSGGIHGTIFKMGESVLTLEVAEKVRILVDRQQVARVAEK